MRYTKKTIIELEAQIEHWEELKQAELTEARAAGFQSGFNQAMQLFRQERKELFKFATMAAIGNAKHDTKLLTEATKAIMKATDEDIDDRVAYRSSY